MFEITKNGGALKSAELEGALEAINRLTRTPLSAEEVYIFSVRACDDLPDRDYERFTPECIAELAKLYVGKTGIIDHDWSAANQVARVYGAEVCKDGAATWLRLDCYLLRLPENASLIAQIDGGIRKEVSIGCAISKATCNICGEPYGSCSHRKGSEYDGVPCIVELSEPVDAYEFSFVAVPAQRAAGVVKTAERHTGMTVEQLDREKAKVRLERARY